MTLKLIWAVSLAATIACCDTADRPEEVAGGRRLIRSASPTHRIEKFRKAGDRVVVTWHALHKGGSSAFIPVLGSFCAILRLSSYSHNRSPWRDARSSFHSNILPDFDNSADPTMRREHSLYWAVPLNESACIGPIRNYDAVPLPLTTRALDVYLLRDPRDCVVSAYFSFGYTHGGAENNAGIRQLSVDEFMFSKEQPIGTAYFYKRLWRPLVSLQNASDANRVQDGDFVLVSYDHMVLAHRHFLLQIATWLGFRDPDAVAETVYAAQCCVPNGPYTTLQRAAQGGAESTQHARAVFPGNHVLHLSRATIERATAFFAIELEILDDAKGGDWSGSDVYPQPTRADWSKVKPRGAEAG